MKKLLLSAILFSAGVLWCSCEKRLRLESGTTAFEVNAKMETRVVEGDDEVVPFSLSEWIETEEFGTVKSFTLLDSQTESVNDEVGAGSRLLLHGEALFAQGSIQKQMTVTTYDAFPALFVTEVHYTYKGSDTLHITRWVNNRYAFESKGDTPDYWSFQGESTIHRRDWILPVSDRFYQKNYMGMNNSDYGGGMPLSCLWRRDAGIAVGHLSLVPELVSIPVEKKRYDDFATLHIESALLEPVMLIDGEEMETLPTFIATYHGDCFLPLRQFSLLMQARGIVMPESEPVAFEPMWCAWGYGRKATFEEIIGTLPKVAEMGIKWVTIDDGYQIAEGDWELDPKRFPGGDRDMINLVKKLKSYGMKVQLWWAPLAADPGTNVLRKHPDFISNTKDGVPHYITWWNSYTLAPGYAPVVEYSRNLVERFIGKYGIDGLKLDGQHLNGVHPDYAHGEDPTANVKAVPDFFKMVYDEARSINPHALLHNCPCGCCMSFYNLPYTNQTVASDPLSSWQIRSRGFVYKALVPKTAYSGDHVELSDGGCDFASQFGVGAVLVSKFTWPKDNPYLTEGSLLTPEKEVVWKKWFGLYNEKMLSTGEYLGGLYDIGYDRPECHVIRKEDALYYSFYAESFNGTLNFKGLDPERTYSVYDYVNDRDLGEISGAAPSLQTAFSNSLLLQIQTID